VTYITSGPLVRTVAQRVGGPAGRSSAYRQRPRKRLV